MSEGVGDTRHQYLAKWRMVKINRSAQDGTGQEEKIGAENLKQGCEFLRPERQPVAAL